MGWFEYALAIIVFFASHSIPLRPKVKPRIVALTGKRGFSIGYSCVSLAALVWLIIAAGRAPYVQLWPWAPWQNWVSLAAIFVACILISLAIGRANPFSFGGGKKTFDVSRPGLVQWMRHPLLVALAIWAFSHVLPNGNLAHVFLFGLFGSFAILGQRAVDRRKKREMGVEWQKLRAQVQNNQALFGGFRADEATVRICAGLSVFLILLGLHQVVLGVNPLP